MAGLALVGEADAAWFSRMASMREPSVSSVIFDSRVV
jgi:hypothetical protein